MSYLYYALDYGKGKIALAWGQGSQDHGVYKRFVDVVANLPMGAILICERSLANYDRTDYNAGLELAFKRGIELRAVSTHPVKNYRKETGNPKVKNGPFTQDIEDAKILLLLFGEGSKRTYGKFQPYVPKELPENLQDRFTMLQVDARRYGKWKEQKKWLKQHKMEQIPVLCSALVVAQEIHRMGGSRKTYRKFTRISEFGRANPMHRSNGTYWLFRNTKKNNWNDPQKRKARAKEVNALIDSIWKVTKVEVPRVTPLLEAFVVG